MYDYVKGRLEELTPAVAVVEASGVGYSLLISLQTYSMHPKIWQASGHVSAFNDPLIDNKDSKKRYRADVLLEDYIAKEQEKVEKEVEKGKKRFGDAFDEAKFRATNPNVLRAQAKADEVHAKMAEALNANDFAALRQLIIDCDIVDPISGTKNWTDVRQFNLMFRTQIGSVSDDSLDNIIYLRPETAQGIFVNYLNVQKTGRMKIPFGIAQIGKAFRNEIVARQFIFRMAQDKVRTPPSSSSASHLPSSASISIDSYRDFKPLGHPVIFGD